MNLYPTARNDEEPNEPLRPHYVYVLLDPLNDNRAFYVGKGTGQRAGAHYRDTKRLLMKLNQEQAQRKLSNDDRSDSYDIDGFTAKQSQIKALIRAGISPLEVIVGRFETADEAFAVESILIHHVFGYENLTNIAGGHGGKYIKSKNQFAEIVMKATKQEDIKPIPGIDENKQKNVRDNTYRDAKRQALDKAKAYDWLESLQKELTDHSFNWRDYSAPNDRRFNPSESNGFLGVIVRIGAIDFNVQFTATINFVIQFIYTQSRQDPDVARDLEALESSQLQLKLGVGKGSKNPEKFKYSWFEPRHSYKTLENLIETLKTMRSILEPSSSQAKFIN